MLKTHHWCKLWIYGLLMIGIKAEYAVGLLVDSCYDSAIAFFTFYKRIFLFIICHKGSGLILSWSFYFISYLISIWGVCCTFRYHLQTSRAEFDDSEYCVRRRYNEFLWLRARLTEAYPTHIVPVSTTTLARYLWITLLIDSRRCHMRNVYGCHDILLLIQFFTLDETYQHFGLSLPEKYCPSP